MTHILVDTDVVSYGLKAHPAFHAFYGPRMEGHTPLVAFMTVAEMEYGARRASWGARRLATLRSYLANHFIVVYPTHKICRTWGRLTADAEAQGRKLHVADGWIAAIAVTYNIPLMTNNRRDFAYLPELDIVTDERMP